MMALDSHAERVLAPRGLARPCVGSEADGLKAANRARRQDGLPTP
jgi:hypothetical protein